ncbi:uncharacterized protein LOC128996060 [Macrosteles quadrilineatus]|uniref:uncharacterized protein LOC128996060 n=1 Tax=Macrosteles quadrilineatus TaxID=74068 RepID=UPI0023E26E90|nr:uncharacterized protein LOC128996060 [Macrosteles quadrilineatus]
MPNAKATEPKSVLSSDNNLIAIHVIVLIACRSPQTEHAAQLLCVSRTKSAPSVVGLSQIPSDSDGDNPALPNVTELIQFLTKECNQIEEANLHSSHNVKTTSDNSYINSRFNKSSATPQTSTRDSSSAHQENSSSQVSSALTSQERCSTTHHPSTVLLGTLLVKLVSPTGVSHIFRALADSGSQSCFLTEHAAQLLCVSRTKSAPSVVGLSQIPTRCKGATSLKVDTLNGKTISTDSNFLILDKICVDLPRMPISSGVIEMVNSYVLADPTFHLPGGIDVLLGGSLFPLMLTQAVHNLGPNLPSLIGSHFGFLVMGDAPCAIKLDDDTSSHMSTMLLAVNDIELHNSIQRFWHQKEPPVASKQSDDDKMCEEHFLSTHSRDQSGRYCDRLPFKTEHPALGNSVFAAEKRLHSLQKKFKAQPQFKSLYFDFMSDYSSSGHIELAHNVDLSASHYYLPHHGVLKESSSTTKLRTVFDASAKTSNGTSLNDILLTGRKMQTNICDLLLMFRTHSVVFSCDIRQMYRQIKVHPEDQKFQYILWHTRPDQPPSTFRLTTVTYGVNCSPYLAIRTLHQLANDEGDSFPEAAEILRTQTFVDDVISGGDSEEEALRLQRQLIALLARGGFELRKWTSNSSRLLLDLPDGHRETPVFLQDSSQPHHTILGIHWSPVTDCFTYNFNFSASATTKRQVLSVIAQIYDPCGFLSPIVMWAKRFMQLLWTKGLDWDQTLPAALLEMWQSFTSSTDSLREISIPRALQVSRACTTALHGFSDASENGYAAVVYLCCELSDGTVTIRQIMSKTRVVPLKKLTILRLELCTAHLLAQIVAYMVSIYKIKLKISFIVLWCDSTITLTWLQTPLHRLKTFVGNRVVQVQELVPNHCWRHISSEYNPADCASRGILPSELSNHELWWSGPLWLQYSSESWPSSNFTPLDITKTGEDKPQSPTTLISTIKPTQEWELLTRFSHFGKLTRVMGYILRFIYNLRHSKRCSGPLTSSELTQSRLTIFKKVQETVFGDDIAALKNSSSKTTSSLRRLHPFIDKSGLLRVGGRLNASQLSEDVKHPIILPKKHHVVDILIDFYHKKYLHSGPQLTQSLLAQSVWILSARSAIRSRIFKCVVCFRHKPHNKIPLMGDLPKPRVTPSRPFLNTGLDYGGPFNIKVHNLRSIRLTKAYICIFFCLVTKAVHIEVATDLSTDAFIAALTRFVSRRGLCKNIYSDCGTNFVGANNAFQALFKSAERTSLLEYSSSQGITFHFNPPAAPHQGGLWEGAIKSAKHHLRRAIGEHVLTLSEFMTLTTHVEAILNSRPLTPMSNDPSDVTALTPEHFLVGAPLVAVPDENLEDVPDNRLKHWHLVKALNQHIWKRWLLRVLNGMSKIPIFALVTSP